MRRYHPLRKRIIAAAMAVSLAAASLGGYIAYGYKNSVPDWIVGSGKDSWGKGVEEYAVEKGLVPTGLGLTGPYWNNSGEGEFPYTFVTTIDAVESGDKGNAGFEEFKGLGKIRAGSSGKTEITRYKHEEGWQTDYNVDLVKLDSETGKPLENAKFDVLEKDTLGDQLPGTDLDDEGPDGALYDIAIFRNLVKKDVFVYPQNFKVCQHWIYLLY